MIYLDDNATTPLCNQSRQAMLPYLDRHFGNPSSVHAAGREARAAIEDSRDRLAKLLAAKSHVMISTNDGTQRHRCDAANAQNFVYMPRARCPVAPRHGAIVRQDRH